MNKEIKTDHPALSTKKTEHKNTSQHKTKDHRAKKHHSKRRRPHYKSKPNYHPTFKKGSLIKCIPIGGHEEVGKNMMVVEYGNDIVVIDCGFQFPEENMYGIDYIIPDTTYLEENKHKIRAMVMTHGHLDHIGGLRHILPKLDFPPVYGLPLTINMVEKHISEFNISKKCRLNKVKLTDTIRAGRLNIEFFHVNHSIPDSMGVVVETPAGRVAHTGDFKFDFNPAFGEQTDYQRLAEIGKKGIHILCGESTNATVPGHTMSEKKVAQNLENLIKDSKGRVIIASFASLFGRIGQIVGFAHKYNRKVFIVGRSMEQNIELALEMKMLNIPKSIFRDRNHLMKSPDKETLVICTGSQGEGLAALSRAAMGDHRNLKIKQTDHIILSSSPIIGNEKDVVRNINNLVQYNCKVTTNKHMDVHTSGHAKQEDLKLMLRLMTPKYLIPIHGEAHMRAAHRDLAMEIGMEEKQIALLNNGDILESDGRMARKSKSKVPANNIFIDAGGDRGGQEGHKIQCDRSIMAENGMLIILLRTYQESGKLIADPDIASRGLIYLKETEEMHKLCKEAAKKGYNEAHQKKYSSEETKNNIKRYVGRIIMNKLKRNPLIVPIIVKI
jgi:ribonuclease J